MKNVLKKMVAPVVLGIGLLVATPAFAYQVKSGDTMKKIASTHDMTLQELKKVNPQIKNPDSLQIGQEVNTDKVESVIDITASEKDLLARLVRAEAADESYAGKVAVATVVLNRVDSDDFPNTVKEVILQKNQFTPVSNGTINNPADATSKKAVEEATKLDRKKLGGSLFFWNPTTSTSRWLESRETVITIGNHVFKK